MRKTGCLILLLCFAALPHRAFASPGYLDTNFSEDGTLVWDHGFDERAYAVAVAGTIVVGGTANGYWTLIRLTPDGKFDRSFNGSGMIISDLGGGSVVKAVAFQEDGKIVAAGDTSMDGNQMFVVIRYEQNGQVDSSFGSKGVKTIDFSAHSDRLTVMAIDSNDRILVAGYANNGHDDDAVVVRLKARGRLDKDFGTDGKVVIPFLHHHNRVVTTDKQQLRTWNDAARGGWDRSPHAQRMDNGKFRPRAPIVSHLAPELKEVRTKTQKGMEKIEFRKAIEASAWVCKVISRIIVK